jgi:hypothetical protein
MKKQLNLVINKLNKHPLISLSIEELRLYFDYRLENLIKDKKVLTRNELDYLLSETGPGNRRIDPRIISEMTHDDIFTCPPYSDIPEFKSLADHKKILDDYVAVEKISNKTNDLIVELLGKYLDGIKIIKNQPLTTLRILPSIWLIGIEKLILLDPCTVATFTPTTLPSSPNSGPPLLPGLIAASV